MTDSGQPSAFSPGTENNGVLVTLGRQDTDLYGPLREWISDAGIADHAAAKGCHAPEFILPDADGRLVSSGALTARGPVVLLFVAGSWCSFCGAKLKAHDALADTVRDLGATIVALTPEVGEFPRLLKRRYELKMEVLSDADCGVGLLYGLVYVVPATIRSLMVERGLDLAVRQGSPTPLLSLPATYVVDPQERIAAAFVETDYTAPPRPKAVRDVLRRL
jgi:peroxiredoxin